MIYVFVTSSLFIVTVIVHIVIHQVLLRRNNITFRAALVFIPGFFINTFLLLSLSQATGDRAFLYVAIIVYGLCTVNYLLFILTPYLGYESVSARIVRMLSQHHALTLADIQRKYTNQAEIGERADSLLKDGFIIKAKSKLKVTKKGKFFIQSVSLFRRLMHLSIVG